MGRKASHKHAVAITFHAKRAALDCPESANYKCAEGQICESKENKKKKDLSGHLKLIFLCSTSLSMAVKRTRTRQRFLRHTSPYASQDQCKDEKKVLSSSLPLWRASHHRCHLLCVSFVFYCFFFFFVSFHLQPHDPQTSA